MLSYTRNKSSVKSGLYLRVLGKRLKENFCLSTEFLDFIFPLNRVSFSGLGLKYD